MCVCAHLPYFLSCFLPTPQRKEKDLTLDLCVGVLPIVRHILGSSYESHLVCISVLAHAVPTAGHLAKPHFGILKLHILTFIYPIFRPCYFLGTHTHNHSVPHRNQDSPSCFSSIYLRTAT